MLTRQLYGFEAPQGAPTSGTHHREYRGQPTSRLPREQATPKQAPSGHPTDSTTQRTPRALDRFRHHTTLLQCSDQPASPTTVPNRKHTHVPPKGPYAPNRSAPASNALTICISSNSLHIGWVPGQPGLARLPAPQDHNHEDDTPRPRTPTPQICLARHPGTSPLNYEQRKLPATRS